MSVIAKQIYEAVRSMPENQATEVLDFVEFLKVKGEQEREARRQNALATLDKYQGLYDGAPFDRSELYERP